MMDFFISYNRADHAWAQWIAWRLEEARYSTVVQAWDFRPGSNFVLEMDRAARQTRTTIAVLSPDYLEAAYTLPEWADAFSRDPKGQGRVLLPVRVRDCKPSGLLGQVVYIDLVGLDEERAGEVLLAQVKGGRAKPVVEPGFPGQVSALAARRPSFAANPAMELPREKVSSRAETGARVLEGATTGVGDGVLRERGTGLAPAVIRRAEQDLALHVGPIAKILVREAASVAQGPEDLYHALANAIPIDGDRKEFLCRAAGASVASSSGAPLLEAGCG